MSIPKDPDSIKELHQELTSLAEEAAMLADTSSLLANASIAADEVEIALNCPSCDLLVSDMCYEDPDLLLLEDAHGLKAEVAAPDLNL